MHKVCFEDWGTTQIKQVNYLSHNNLDPTTTLSFTFRIPVFEHTKDLTLNPLLCLEGVSPDHIEVDCLDHPRYFSASISWLGHFNSHASTSNVGDSTQELQITSSAIGKDPHRMKLSLIVGQLVVQLRCC